MRSVSLGFRIAILVLAGWLCLLYSPFALGHESSDLQITVHSNALEHTILDIEIAHYDMQPVLVDSTEYQMVGLHGEGRVIRPRPGYPSLPAVYRSLMIPNTAHMEVTVSESSYIELTDIDLISSKGKILRTIDPATVPFTFNEIYEQDAWFPGDLAKLRDPYILRDVRGQVVEVFPFQYNPVQRILRVYTNMQVEVTAVAESTQNIIDRTRTPEKPDLSFYALYMNHFINSGATRGDPPSEDGNMLIISHGPWMTNMQPFVDWKNSIGINTTIVDVATIGNNATAIKTYISDLYNSSNLAFVLLVGDNNEVRSSSYGSGLSDADYSVITPDNYPDIFVGRFSANSAADVDTQVERTVTYEQEGHDLSMGGWNTYGMGVASNQGSGIGHYGESDDEHMDLIRDELLAYGFAKVDRIYDYSGTAAQVTAGLNEGRRVVNYCGHGSTTSWGSTGFSNTHVNALQNVGTLPFICSVACVNGAFGSTTCFAEAWMRATYNGEPTGAIGCYMSTVNQSWAPPMYAEGNHTYSSKYGAAERFWMEMNWSLGGCWYGGSCCMMDLAGSTGVQEFMNWVIFGDPSLRLTSMPALTISFPEGVPEGIFPPGPETDLSLQINPGAENYVPGSGYLYYRFDSADAYTAVAVTPEGGNRYSAVIPNTSPGDEPEFYFEAEGDGGTTICSPATAPSSVYSFEVCFVETLLVDDFETATGWTVENTSISTGAFERGDPIGTDAQPENDHSDSGTMCYVTGRLGGSIGDYDVDGGPTQLISPAFDLSSGDAEISFYYYFYHSTNGTMEPLKMEITNNGTLWTTFASVGDSPNWTRHSIKVSDYVTPNANIQLRFSAEDNPNDSVVEALIDDLMIQRFNYDPSLWADCYSIPVSTGEVIDLTLDAGAAYAGRSYVMLGSMSGTSPGMTLPGGLNLPLNWDYFTKLVRLLTNTVVLQQFAGTLDGSGGATATINTMGSLDPVLIGETANFAAVLTSPYDFVSNPIPVTFDP